MVKIAEDVRASYKSRESSGDWAKWSGENPDMANILSEAANYAGKFRN